MLVFRTKLVFPLTPSNSKIFIENKKKEFVIGKALLLIEHKFGVFTGFYLI